MTLRGFMITYTVLALFLANYGYAQMLIPLYGACTSSVQCVGVAICFNHVCQCPPVYNAVGITCVYAGLDPEFLPPPPQQMAAPPMPYQGPQMAPGPAQPAVPFSYPGLPCSPAKTCMGNSVCVQGTCGCPTGQVVAGYNCVQPNRVFAGGPPMPAPGPYGMPRPVGPGQAPYFGPMPGDEDLDFLFGSRGFPMQGPQPGPGPMPSTCPPAQIPLGPECVPPSAIVNFPSPVPCVQASPAPCIGGASCVAAVCTCPAPLVWGGSACVPPPMSGPPAPAPMPGPPPQQPHPYLAVPQMIVPATFVAPGPPPPPPPPVAVRPMMQAPMPGPGGALSLGSSCNAHNQCVVGAFCQLGVCQCRPAFLPYGSICVLRRRAKDEAERSNANEKSEKKN